MLRSRQILMMLTIGMVLQGSLGLPLRRDSHISTLTDPVQDDCESWPWQCEDDDGEAFFMPDAETIRRGRQTNLHCPVIVNTDLNNLKERRQAGPVHSPEIEHAGKTHLFLLAAPHTGSTGIASMIATSPAVSTLCSPGKWACEGTWSLIDEGVFSLRDRWKPDLPSNWSEALDVYARHWNSSASVFMDKSPPNIAKAERIFSQLQGLGKHVKFIFMTRSPCYQGSWWQPHHTAPNLASQMEFLMHAESNLPNSSYLLVRHEDLIRDPYGEATRILEFLPELRSLDPAKNGLSGNTGPTGGHSLVDYIQQNAPFTNHMEYIEDDWLPFMQKFGHDHQ